MGTQKRIAIMIHVMSPEIFPMFTEAVGDIIFLGLTVRSNFPDVSATGGLRDKSTVALSVVGAILFLGTVLAFAFFCFIRHQQKKTAEHRSQLFPVYNEKHQVKYHVTRA